MGPIFMADYYPQERDFSSGTAPRATLSAMKPFVNKPILELRRAPHRPAAA